LSTVQIFSPNQNQFGCAFFKLKEELVELDETFDVRGKITYDTSRSGSVLVIMSKKMFRMARI
jgi:hypothetical protein